jgi:proton-dependent oligopeptide transporter, POT family
MGYKKMNQIAIEKPIKQKQPKVFHLTYFTTIFERFGFYVLSFLLVLYAKDVYTFTDAQTFTLFGIFTALAFLTPAIGGYIADNFIGIRRCMIWGLFLEATGLVLAAIPNRNVFLFSLAMVILGVGLFKIAPTNLLARSYEENDPRIDSGFTLYYMAINLGSMFSPIAAGFLQKYFGWDIAFLVGGIGIYIGLFFYFLLRKSAVGLDTKAGENHFAIYKALAFIIGLIISAVLCVFLLQHTMLANIFFGVATFATFVYFLVEIVKSPKSDKLKIIACLYLVLIGFAFSVLYFQAFTSIELFIQRSVIRDVLGINIPTLFFMSLNSIFVILLGPILAFIYNKLAAKNRDLSVVTKLTLGLFIGSLCFFCITAGSYFADIHYQISWIWIILFFFLYTIGDLMNSALGVAMVTRIAPKRLYGVMMGTWFLVGNALAAAVAGIFAGLTDIPDNLKDTHAILNIYKTGFTKIGIAGVAMSIIAFIVNPYIKKIIKNS